MATTTDGILATTGGYFTYESPLYLTVLTGLIGVVGVAANGFVLFVLYRYGKLTYTPSILLMLHQTATDTTCSLMLLLSGALYMSYDGDVEVVCRLFISEAVVKITFVASAYSLVCITIERYVMVVHAVYHRNHFTHRVTAVLIVLTWTVGVVLSTPLVTMYDMEYGQCRLQWSTDVLMSYVVLNFMLIFIIPIIVIVYGYGMIIHRLVRRERTIQTESTGGDNKSGLSKSQKNITKTMIIVAVGYIICVLPLYTFFIIYELALESGHLSESIYHHFLALLHLNCCINPFIYAIKYDTFKSGCRRMCGEKGQTSNKGRTTTDTSVTNQTRGEPPQIHQ